MKVSREDLQKQLKIEPDVFQGEGTLNPKDFHFGHTLDSYEKWLDEEEQKHRSDEIRKLYMKEMKLFLMMPNLVLCGHKYCSGCGNLMVFCHNIVFGAFCVWKAVKYCTESPDSVCDVTIKKVFVDTYNHCLEFTNFRGIKEVPEDWLFPPICMQDNSFGYAIFFYEWIIKSQWDADYSDSNEDSKEE